MAKTDTFKCSVITPERVVLESDANFAAFPAHDGEMGILPHRAPLVCKLGIGAMRVESPGQKHTLFVDGGFAEVAGNHLTVLTQQAKTPDAIDKAAAELALAAARVLRVSDESSHRARSDAIRRARAQINLAKS